MPFLVSLDERTCCDNNGGFWTSCPMLHTFTCGYCGVVKLDKSYIQGTEHFCLNCVEIEFHHNPYQDHMIEALKLDENHIDKLGRHWNRYLCRCAFECSLCKQYPKIGGYVWILDNSNKVCDNHVSILPFPKRKDLIMSLVIAFGSKTCSKCYLKIDHLRECWKFTDGRMMCKDHEPLELRPGKLEQEQLQLTPLLNHTYSDKHGGSWVKNTVYNKSCIICTSKIDNKPAWINGCNQVVCDIHVEFNNPSLKLKFQRKLAGHVGYYIDGCIGYYSDEHNNVWAYDRNYRNECIKCCKCNKLNPTAFWTTSMGDHCCNSHVTFENDGTYDLSNDLSSLPTNCVNVGCSLCGLVNKPESKLITVKNNYVCEHHVSKTFKVIQTHTGNATEYTDQHGTKLNLYIGTFYCCYCNADGNGTYFQLPTGRLCQKHAEITIRTQEPEVKSTCVLQENKDKRFCEHHVSSINPGSGLIPPVVDPKIIEPKCIYCDDKGLYEKLGCKVWCDCQSDTEWVFISMAVPSQCLYCDTCNKLIDSPHWVSRTKGNLIYRCDSHLKIELKDSDGVYSFNGYGPCTQHKGKYTCTVCKTEKTALHWKLSDCNYCCHAHIKIIKDDLVPRLDKKEPDCDHHVIEIPNPIPSKDDPRYFQYWVSRHVIETPSPTPSKDDDDGGNVYEEVSKLEEYNNVTYREKVQDEKMQVQPVPVNTLVKLRSILKWILLLVFITLLILSGFTDSNVFKGINTFLALLSLFASFVLFVRDEFKC